MCMHMHMDMDMDKDAALCPLIPPCAKQTKPLRAPRLGVGASHKTSSLLRDYQWCRLPR